MCARFSITKEEITMLIGVVEVVIKIQARFNVAPRQKSLRLPARFQKRI